MDRGAWWATVMELQSRTQLKGLSTDSRDVSKITPAIRQMHTRLVSGHSHETVRARLWTQETTHLCSFGQGFHFPQPQFAHL